MQQMRLAGRQTAMQVCCRGLAGWQWLFVGRGTSDSVRTTALLVWLRRADLQGAGCISTAADGSAAVMVCQCREPLPAAGTREQQQQVVLCAAVLCAAVLICCAERGMLFHKQRDYRRAVKELAKATELDPSNAQVSDVSAVNEVAMHADHWLAFSVMAKATELHPSNAQVRGLAQLLQLHMCLISGASTCIQSQHNMLTASHLLRIARRGISGPGRHIHG